MSISRVVARYVDDEDGARSCYSVLTQLRPHITSETEFIARWYRQVSDGYRLLALFDDSRILALAGYRFQENLVYGRHLYVDDLVTDAALRGQGYGEQLMTRLKHEARSHGCAKVVLDTPLSNALGHRFYFRNGLLATALRFNMVIAQ